MNTLLKSISLNGRLLNVRVLHKTLAAQGFLVSKREVACGRIGKDIF